MAVHHDVSRQYIRSEMSVVQELAGIHGWELAIDYDRLRVVVRLQAHTGEIFVVEACCDNYKEMPPFIEFVDPDTGERGTRRAYPKGTDSFFHSSGPCVCAPFSRKAYKSVVNTGPHGEWPLSDWMNSTALGIHWSNHSTLAGIFEMIQARLNRPDCYVGRMAQ